MKDNPPTPSRCSDDRQDGTKLGIAPGEEVRLRQARPRAKPLKDVPKLGFEKIMAHFKQAGEDINGWTFTTKAGLYGTDYLQRALITAIGLGANRPQDAVYPTSETDAEGKPYMGTNKYVMHFAKGQMPPVDGFWSLTMYNEQYVLRRQPAQPLHAQRPQQVRRRTPTARSTSTCNTRIPGKDKESNWLPAPEGRFIPMLRLYWPKTAQAFNPRRHLEAAGDQTGRRQLAVAQPPSDVRIMNREDILRELAPWRERARSTLLEAHRLRKRWRNNSQQVLRRSLAPPG